MPAFPVRAPRYLAPSQVAELLSIGVDEVKLRMVARTLPGKQFDAGRRLRQMVVADLRREGIDSRTPATVDAA